MKYILKNHELTVTVSDKGAELISVRREDCDCEYIWQADPAFWSGQAPLLFPICGRLFDGHYTVNGKTYSMNLHGFARHSVFLCEKQQEENSLCFTLSANEETKKIYPFDFVLSLVWRLTGNTLACDITVKNTGLSVLPATVGAHPGINVPLGNNDSAFEDWFLEFGNVCNPDELVFSDTCFNTGRKRAFPLKDGKILCLRHSLFDIDGVFLSRTSGSVTLKSQKSNRFVRVEYPDMPYLGIWHKPKSEAPYLCIEPWCGLPSFDGVVDDFSEKCDMFRILPGDQKTVRYTLIFG